MCLPKINRNRIVKFGVIVFIIGLSYVVGAITGIKVFCEDDNKTTTRDDINKSRKSDTMTPHNGEVDNRITNLISDFDEPTGPYIKEPANGEVDNRTIIQGPFDQPTESKISLFKQRLLEKKSLGCKPRLVAIYTKSLLDPKDKISDMEIRTPYQYVNQCKTIMNYCPGIMECVPTEDGKRPYKMSFRVKSFSGFEGIVERVVENLEHTECECRPIN